MNIADFTNKIREQFLEVDQPFVTPDKEFRNLETWDSLTGMAVLTIIEDSYEVAIPVEDFRQMNTIKELFIYVESHK